VLVNAVCVSVQAELAVEAWSAAGEELLNVAASTSDRPTTSSAKLGGRRNPLELHLGGGGKDIESPIEGM
jgi:hypothetical protein